MKIKNSVAVFLISFFSMINAQEITKPSCAVVGFVNEIKNPDWQDGRVGMGVRAMLTQALAESGNFMLLDEKPEIAARLKEISAGAWLAEKSETIMDSASGEMKKSGADFVAYGKVFYFGKPRTRASVGPAHFASEEVQIKLEVTLLSTKDNKKITAIGSGAAATTAMSGLFTFHGENLDPDNTMVGTATNKAIQTAVTEVITKYKKQYKIK